MLYKTEKTIRNMYTMVYKQVVLTVVIKKVKLINHDCLPILMLLYTMLYIVLAYLMLFAALTNSVCLNNASFFFFFLFYIIFFMTGL